MSVLDKLAFSHMFLIESNTLNILLRNDGNTSITKISMKWGSLAYRISSTSDQ